jgi:hypothetical protein
MITFTKAYIANGKTYATLREAQAAELEGLLRDYCGSIIDGVDTTEINKIVEFIVEDSAKVIDILTTKGDSRPKARALNGGRKPRKPASSGTPEAATTLNI